jgi:hypothetical protein
VSGAAAARAERLLEYVRILAPLVVLRPRAPGGWTRRASPDRLTLTPGPPALMVRAQGGHAQC